MSPATTFGPLSPVTSIKAEGPVTAQSATPGAMTAAINGLRGTNRVYPHLDDLVGVRPEYNEYVQIRKILQDGHQFAKQADTHLDFGRPDLALQEYIKALIVVTDLVPKHRDYVLLQSDRGDLHRLYTGLSKKITAQHQKFVEVKDLVKENNERSGVKPMAMNKESAPLRVASPVIGHARSQSMQSPAPSNSSNSGYTNGNSRPPVTSSSGLPRQKPIVHRKPDALVGKAIQPSDSKASDSSQVDLAARFARLRGTNSPVPVQDPRIRTRPISIPENANGIPDTKPVSQEISAPTKNILRPAGPREMPSVPVGPLRPAKMKLPIDVNIPIMPRAPDAIYSPARSADTETTINFPSSTPRTSHIRNASRQNSSSSISKVVRTLSGVDDSREYFSPAHPIEGYSGFVPQRKSQEPARPTDKTSITPTELVELTKKFKILLVDIRTREEFNQGHIMSQSIVCVEPITIRPNVTAEALENSMILAPDLELELFKNRHEFDLIVFYNQSSSEIGTYSTSSTAYKTVFRDFRVAVYDYGLEKKSKQIPVLLAGGLDAWIGLMGPNCLQSFQDGATSSGPSQLRHVKPLSRYVTPQESYRTAAERKKKFESRLLSAEEEKKWDDKLREETPIPNEDADSTAYARTTEDFFRRFPPVSMESMVSPRNETFKQQRLEDEFKRELASTTPAPPARPPPALPRQSFSGVSHKGQIHMMAAQNSSISNTIVQPGLTGLHNFGQTCYMNSAIQCLSATGLLKNYLVNYQYPPPVLPPRKPGEVTEPPQLMVRNLGNLLRYLWSGQYTYVTPKTFREYVRRLHGMRRQRPERHLLGGANQQDSMEFLSYLLENLNDELNPGRNTPVPPPYTSAEEAIRGKQPLLQCAIQDWQRRMQYESSPINDMFQVMSTGSITCQHCGYKSVTPDSTTGMILPMQSGANNYTLDGLFQHSLQDDELEYTCDSCKKKSARAQKRVQLSRLPTYMIVQLGRFATQNGVSTKIGAAVDFPLEGLDLTKYTLWNNASPSIRTAFVDDSEPLSGFKGPFRYRLYGIIEHIGADLGSGHYVGYSRDENDPNAPWHEFNDSVVKPHKEIDGSIKKRAYILFYRRVT